MPNVLGTVHCTLGDTMMPVRGVVFRLLAAAALACMLPASAASAVAGWRADQRVDYAPSFPPYQRAATGDAQSRNSSLYMIGDGIAQDLRKALDWYTLAARQGDVGAAAQAKDVARRLGAQP